MLIGKRRSKSIKLCLFDYFVTIRLGAIIAQICKEKNAVCGFRQRNDNNSQSYYPTKYRLFLFQSALKYILNTLSMPSVQIIVLER